MGETSCSRCFRTDRFPGSHIGPQGLCSACGSDAFRKRVEGATPSNLAELQNVADDLKSRGGKYHCIVGASGGLDSSYTLYIAKRMLGLNPLAVTYDHGFFYDEAKQNLVRLCRALDIDLRTLTSRGQHDLRFVRAAVRALDPMERYWGICKFCHRILPQAAMWVAWKEGITTQLRSGNLYEAELDVPQKAKWKAMASAFLRHGLVRSPLMAWHLAASKYHLLRLRAEFHVPPLRNLWGPLRSPAWFRTISVTRYVPWDVDTMLATLTREADWRLPDRPSLGMRFDCMIEDGFINGTYKAVTGATVHSIIADNLIRAGVRTRDQLQPAVEYYDQVIERRKQEARERLGLGGTT